MNISIEKLTAIGSPFIQTFHKCKENTFLNTQYSGAKGLEKAGDCLLTPYFYLFGGRCYQEDGNGYYEVFQKYAYKGLCPYLLMSLCVLVLPITLALGALCKGIAYATDEAMRTRLAAIKENPFGTKPPEPMLSPDGFEILMKDDVAAPLQNLGCSRPEKKSHKHECDIEAARAILSILEAGEIPCWLEFGSALGAYRYGGIIPWDHDVDFGTLKKDQARIFTLLKAGLDPEKYTVQDWSCYSNPQSILKVYVKETHSFIDLYSYNYDEESGDLRYNSALQYSELPLAIKEAEIDQASIQIPYNMMFPLRRADFDGIDAWVPNEVEFYLKLCYGDDLRPTMTWNETTGQYERVLDHPYWNKAHVS